MIVIEVRFLSGRFHANPWGRNVNEGEVEWPLSPFRLARALIDAWQRRFPEWSAKRMERIIMALSGPPYFHLPMATSSHTRSFLNTNQKNPSEKQKIFDAFVVVDPLHPVYIGFDAILSEEEFTTLNMLLQHLNYFGRSESWINARLVCEPPDLLWNCKPVWANKNYLELSETVPVACLQSPDGYGALPIRPARRPWQAEEPGEGDCTLFEAITLSTADLLKEGWSDHPAITWINYSRPASALTGYIPKKSKKSREFRFVKYALHANVLPIVEETISVAERVRSHLIGIHKRIMGNDTAHISRCFSGKDETESPLTGHEHAFYLPLDEDGDGRIDHLIIQSAVPFTSVEIKALDSLHSVWQPNGREDIRFVLTSILGDARPIQYSTWVSATPFITSRHYRKGRGQFLEWMKEEIERECEFHGLPKPDLIRFIDQTVNTITPKPWWRFRRGRKGSKSLAGYGLILKFKESVNGPFALGTLCHFGLGLFTPLK